MIQVVEAKEVARQVFRVHCEFCGAVNDLLVVRMVADGQETHKANLTICCDETRDRVNQGSTGGN
jgi:hypothetical protein